MKSSLFADTIQSSDTYYFSWLNIENGAGQNRDLISSEFSLYPQIISFNQKIPMLPISITLIEKHMLTHLHIIFMV